MAQKLHAVQSYIEKLSYNFTGVNYFDVRKQRPLGRILETAREITRQALPIKCVEAVFVAAYLTQGFKELERIPISFKSQIDGQTYKHIVLAVKCNSKWGSVGLSRRRELYYKELVYDSLAELVLEFKRSYERVFHALRRVKVGLPLSHDVYAGEHVCWSYLTVKLNGDMTSAVQLLADHGRTAHRLQEQWRAECKKATSSGQKPPTVPKKASGPKRGDGSDSSDAERKEPASEAEAGGKEGKRKVDAGADASDSGGEEAKAAAKPVRAAFLAV